MGISWGVLDGLWRGICKLSRFMDRCAAIRVMGSRIGLFGGASAHRLPIGPTKSSQDLDLGGGVEGGKEGQSIPISALQQHQSGTSKSALPRKGRSAEFHCIARSDLNGTANF